MTATALTPTLAKAGFGIPTTETPYRAVLMTVGKDKTGKTHFAMTAPDPIAVISMDMGTEEIVQKAIRAGKQVVHRPHKIPRPGASQQDFVSEWEELRRSIEAATLAPSIRTVVVDTGTECWELLRMARFGRLESIKPHHYGEVNREFRDLVKLAEQERRDLNAIWIHKMKKEYRQNKKGDDSWTGKYEPAGFSDMPFLVDVVIEHDWKRNEEGGGGEFNITVPRVARQMPDIAGLELTGEMLTFPTLAMMLYPESGMEDWK